MALEIRNNDEQNDPNDATGANVPMAVEAGVEQTEEQLADATDDAAEIEHADPEPSPEE